MSNKTLLPLIVTDMVLIPHIPGFKQFPHHPACLLRLMRFKPPVETGVQTLSQATSALLVIVFAPDHTQLLQNDSIVFITLAGSFVKKMDDVFVTLRFNHGDIIVIFVTHLVEEPIVVPPALPPITPVGGESFTAFDNPTCEDINEKVGAAATAASTTSAADDDDDSDLESKSESEESDNVVVEEGEEEEFDSDVHEEDKNLKKDRVAFRKALTRYAVQKHVELDKYVNEPTRVRVKCTAGCPWLLFASYDSRTNDFVVKNYNPVHKCNDTTKNKLVNSLYISERYKDRIIFEPGIRIFELQNLVRKELEVYIGRTLSRKARSIVLQQIMGDNVEEFKRILDYRDELLRTNPGSTCVVRLSKETFEGGIKRFQSFYICFDAMKTAFKAGCRRAIGLDGCILKGVSKGQLLVAVCKDGNNQMLPLA
ncbi:uncharacterized protein LOC132620073 [Lycium barbarum]|uniref:uncharacterized protein LOC132620073 n=1 Tax=Lycium barbarum TaxID=112863 RepID=UPI00293F1168|nr:uncharacterized protein LOC132620073 [Lycium barbarum]